jgi:hypothetical protein
VRARLHEDSVSDIFKRVALDLSGLRFVDDEGVRFLRECRRRGASLLGALPFVSALLDPPLPRQRRPRS